MKKRHVSPTTKLAFPLACAMAASVGLPAKAQESATPSTEPEKMEKVIVTGSNIAEPAGAIPASPVEIANSEEIAATGSTDALAVLKKVSTGFAGNGNIGQTVNNGGFGESTVALRNLPTLVLLDGRRLANSTFSQGTAVDLNTIPIGMIDRIEILKDGASSIYGADAVGGVVNIITKKNYTGAEVSGRYGFATGQGSIAEEQVSVVAGTSTDKTSVTMGGSWYHMDPLPTIDRYPANLTAEQKYNLGISPAMTSRYAARVGNYLLAGSPLAVGAPGYNAGYQTPPVLPGGVFDSVEAYNTAAIAAGYKTLGPDGTTYGPYIPISSTPIAQRSGTTAFYYFPQYTYSIQEQNRYNAFANFNHQIFDKNLELFGSFMYSHEDNISHLAPSPVGNLFSEGHMSVPANNPYNPFGIPLGVGGKTDPTSPQYDPNYSEPNVRTRFIDFGPRIFDSQKDYFHFVGGLKGEISDRYDWEAGYNYNRSDEMQRTMNAVNGSALNQSMVPNFNIAPPAGKPAGYYSQLQNFQGQYVPTYNPFAPEGFNSQDTIDALNTSLYQSGVSELWSVDATFRGRPVDLPAGPLNFAAGFQYINEMFSRDFDGLTKLGLVPGLNQSFTLPPVGRERWAGFAEVRIPVFSPDKNIPVFHDFEIDASGRYESLSPGGDTEVPKVGFKWQPVDEQITIRGTYSQGFIAPSLYSLYSPPTISNPNLGFGGGVTAQETVQYLSNPNIPPATSDNYTIGIVLAPKCIKNLSLYATYYNITEEGTSYFPDPNSMLSDLNARGSGSQWNQYYTQPNGTHLTSTAANQITPLNWGTMQIPTLPGGAQRTDGIDLGMEYKIETESAGKFTLACNANLLMGYEYRPGPGQPYYSYKGMYTDAATIGVANGTLPDFQVIPSLTWEYRNLTYTVLARYIPGVDDFGDGHPLVTGGYVGPNSYTLDGSTWKVPSYYTIDMQLAYQFKSQEGNKWYDGLRLAFGVNNITDEVPPVISSAFEDNTDKSTYDILGRFAYLEVSKKF